MKFLLKGLAGHPLHPPLTDVTIERSVPGRCAECIRRFLPYAHEQAFVTPIDERRHPCLWAFNNRMCPPAAPRPQGEHPIADDV